jgi:ribosomal protein L11 methyltransferase
LEELPADGRRCFPARGTVRFDRVADHERWVRSEKFQHGNRVRLKAYFNLPVIAGGVEVPADYLAQYRAQHRGGRVGRRLWVGPPWERPPRGRCAVIIEPGTAFGTGDHPTTQMCLAALERLRERPRCAFDIGTGSGVLAIAIARLFPRCRLAISDNDARCAGEVKRNFALNGLRAPRFAKRFRAETYDLVVANLYSETLKTYLPLVAGSRRWIVSGMRRGAQEQDFLRTVKRTSSFRVEHRQTSQGWVCLTLVRPIRDRRRRSRCSRGGGRRGR